MHVDESTLNGESVPAYKSVKEEEFEKDASYATNQVLRGTKVMEGHGIFQVEAVGDRTEMVRCLRLHKLMIALKHLLVSNLMD